MRSIQEGSQWTAKGERREHGGPDPGDDFPGVTGIDQGQPPTDAAGNDEAFGTTEHYTANQQDCNRQSRRLHEDQRQKIQHPRHGGGDKAEHDAALSSMSIRIGADPDARHHGRGELRARHQTDNEGPKPETLVHIERQHRQGRANHNEAGEHGRHDRQQRHGNRPCQL